jgi:hypothetical protein
MRLAGDLCTERKAAQGIAAKNVTAGFPRGGLMNAFVRELLRSYED